MVNLGIPLSLTKVEKVYMHDLMVESSKKGACNDEKTDDFKQNLLIKSFLRRWKILAVRYLSDAVNAATASYAKNTIKLRYSV